MRPRLLDLFCGAGGSAVGYDRAGFDVVGVDLRPQPRYPFGFWRADALEVLRTRGTSIAYHFADGYDAIHASPPCQAYANVTSWRGDQADHVELIDETRILLEATGLPWVIENVAEAPVRRDGFLCGTMFGLPIRRHRSFETSWGGVILTQQCQHRSTDLAFEHKAERAYADAMGCEWMTAHEARQAIPPAYTELIGHQLMQVVMHTRDARDQIGPLDPCSERDSSKTRCSGPDQPVEPLSVVPGVVSAPLDPIDNESEVHS